MIERAGRYGLKDHSAQNEITVYSNWNSLVKGNKFLKLKIGEESVIVETDELRNLIIMLSETEKALDLMPSTKKEVKEYLINFEMFAPKDMRRGEILRGSKTIRI